MKKRVKDRDEGKKIKTENRTKENENSRSRNGGGGDGISRVRARVILCEPVNNRAKCAVSHLRQTLATTTVPRDPKDLCFRLTATAAAARVKILFNASGFVFPPSHSYCCCFQITIEIKNRKTGDANTFKSRTQWSAPEVFEKSANIYVVDATRRSSRRPCTS